MIKLNNVTKAFSETIAVNNLTLEIQPGVTGLVGHNGAGKTTLLRLISDVYDCTSGTIFIDDKSNQDCEVKKDVFFLSDDPYFAKNSTIRGVIDYYSMFYSIDMAKFNRLIREFELPIDRKISGYSKGMKRQLFIILTLSMKCKYLLMDEAFDGIDPMILEKIKDEIIHIISNENKTLILSSHNVSLIERLCDKLIILTKGSIGQNGNMEDMGTNYFKYQCLFDNPTDKRYLESLGIEVVYFKKNGSLINFVSRGEVDVNLLKKHINVVLFENVPIDGAEMITLEMIEAKERENNGIKLGGNENE